MKRRPETTALIFGVMGGLLLLYLVFPLVYFLFHLEWGKVGTWLADPRALQAVQVSLLTSGTATAIMTLLGVPLGYLLARARFRGRHLLTSLVFLPMALPPLVGGILLLLIFGPYGLIGALFEGHGLALVNSLAGIVLAQVFVAAPYVIITSLSAFASIDETLEQAAATLGKTRWQVFRRVSLPLAWQGIAAGMTLAWVRTLGEFGATLVIAYHPHTLPIFLWEQLTGAGLPAALPLVLLLIAMAGGAMAVVHLFGRLPVPLSVRPEVTPFPPEDVSEKLTTGEAPALSARVGSRRMAEAIPHRLRLAVRKRWESFRLDLDLEAGHEILVLFGPSGAGKSLTLQCLAGLVRPDEGYIALGDRALFDSSRRIELPPRDRNLGYLFQSYSLFPHLTLGQNIAFGLGHLPASEVERRVKEMIALLRLDGLEERYPHQLSGGEQQRAALARALARDPELLLLDEPFSALDHNARERLRHDLLRIHRLFKPTILFVTHSLEEAYLLGDRIAILSEGTLLQVGTPEEVLNRPKSRVVAQITATRNFLRGRIVARTPGEATVLCQRRTLRIPLEEGAVGQEVEFCIRPEHVRLVWPERAAERENLLQGWIVQAINRGLNRTLFFKMDGWEGREYDLEIHVADYIYRLMGLEEGKRALIYLPLEFINVFPPP
ncbi:MAG: ATP-binding cassette domain-containing protein [candidate division NC10 bacterium]|nr:ATP-binding cassette domain-containing protein [candidate division NC10 bacterium]